MFIYRGECRFCGRALKRTLSYRYDGGSFSVGCDDCDQAESILEFDEIVGEEETAR